MAVLCTSSVPPPGYILTLMVREELDKEEKGWAEKGMVGGAVKVRWMVNGGTGGKGRGER